AQPLVTFRLALIVLITNRGEKHAGANGRTRIAPARRARAELVSLQPDLLVRAAVVDRRLRHRRDRLCCAAPDARLAFGRSFRAWSRPEREPRRHPVRLRGVRL